MNDDIPDNHSSHFVADLERVMSAAGMSQTQFGYLHFGNPGFMTRARAGCRFHKKTVQKVRELLASNAKGK